MKYKITFFNYQAYKDRKLGYDATQLSWHTNGEYLLISGSNRQCNLYTNEGIKLHTLAEKNSWVLCAKHKPNSNFIVSNYLIRNQFNFIECKII